MANSTKAKPATKLVKPRPDFPLFPHATGRWAKKVLGKLEYFGKVANDPKGEKAYAQWLDDKDELLAGRKPRRKMQGGLTVEQLCVRFLTAKENRRDAGELSADSFSDYLRACKIISATFGRKRLVDDLRAEDFESLRASLSKQYGVCRLGNTVGRVRSVFKYGYESGLIEKPMRFGPEFKKPTKRIMRKHRQKGGERMFEADQIRTLLDAADQPLKAMILLGINCGFGNNDCGTLPMSALDLVGGWINYPRPKTSVERRCPLWPETVAAIKDAIACRPAASDERHNGFVFITKFGHSWAKEIGFVQVDIDAGKETKVTGDSGPITKEFRKLIDRVDATEIDEAKKSRRKPAAKIYRRGIGFYALRHTFETIGGESLDQVAVNAIMAHVDNSMAAEYRERIGDDRLRAVADRIRVWLFPQSVSDDQSQT